MSNIILQGQKTETLEFVSKLENGTKVELQTQYAYHVNYANNNLCRGEMTITVTDKDHPSLFRIRVVQLGIFSFEPSMPKEKIHVETYKALFPYVRAMITTITANAGIPPIIVQGIDIESQSIYRVEKHPENLIAQDDEEEDDA